MTNLGEINSSTQKPLIPAASIRAEKSSSKSVSSRAQQKLIIHQDQNMRPSGKSTTQNQNQTQNVSSSSGSGNEEVWTSMENLFWDHMNEVENKWNTLKLNDDIWAKLIYFEQNRRLAKAYVSAPVLTVDGSTHGLDGFRIGLSGIDNSYRNLDSIACLRSIGHGIKLKIDNHGNILIRKAGQANQNSTSHCSVWVKDWPLPMTAPSKTTTKIKQSSLTDTCVMREIEQSDASYKLFDMRKFRLQLEKRRLNNEQVMDWRQCVSIVSFVQSKDIAISKHKLLDDPCWLMLINIIAIDMIKSSMIRDERGSMNLDLELQDGSPTFMQNHSLLGVGNYARAMDGPFKASSSSSILFPTNGSTTASSIYNYRGNPLSGTTDSVNNLSVATNERIKKLRSANSKYRLSSLKNGSYHRRYQSIQQLSSAAAAMSNNTIYTTFNSKFINNANNINSNNVYKPAQMTGLDSSSTSDYNSFSRSASSGHRLNNLKLLYNDSSAVDSSKLQNQQHHQQRLPSASSKYHRDDGKMLFSRKALEPLLDSGNKSLSLSTFDLSHRKFDLRSMQSSIKMNYDYLTENVDTLAYEEDDDDNEDIVDDDQDAVTEEKSVISSSVVNPHSMVNTGSKHVLSLSNHKNSYPKSIPNFTLGMTKETSSCCCTANEKVKHCNHEHFHQHHRESPFKVRQATEIDGNLVKVDSTRKEHQQKVSRASIASSSSSSGCADNDYFMSQSSSSMSSSTASNERELFSQPASSSGIVCSGSTSDEYEDGQNKQAVKSDTEIITTEQLKAANSSALESVDRMSKENGMSIEGLHIENHVNSKQQQQQVGSKKSHTNRLNIRRGYLKTIEPTDFCCPPASAIGLDITGSDQECQCPTLDYNCHCCCDCFSQSIEPTTCGCEDDLIFERLQHAASTTNLPTTTSITINSSKANKRGEQEMINRLEKVVLPSSLSKVDEKLSNSEILLQQQDLCSNKSTKDLKQTSGWLERRKYSKILPKFIFSSNGGNRQVAATSTTSTTNQRDKFIQRDDSNSKNDKFRFTSKSNQDLS